MFYSYVLKSKKDGRWYTGTTENLRKRFNEHKEGKVISTKGRNPLELIYYEGCCNKQDAYDRERYLKSGWGKRYLKNRMKRFLSPTGFTLMELMVVVAIMGILIMASMPLFRSFARGRNLKEGANMVMSALRKSREAAITYRKNYKTVLDTLNQAVAIYEDNDIVNPAENWAKLPEFVKFDNSSSDWTVSYNYGGGIYWVEFKPNGGCTEGKTIVLLEESTSDTKRIIFTNLTGRIRIE